VEKSVWMVMGPRDATDSNLGNLLMSSFAVPQDFNCTDSNHYPPPPLFTRKSRSSANFVPIRDIPCR